MVRLSRNAESVATAHETYPAHRREVGGQRRGHVQRPDGPREARGKLAYPRAGRLRYGLTRALLRKVKALAHLYRFP